MEGPNLIIGDMESTLFRNCCTSASTNPRFEDHPVLPTQGTKELELFIFLIFHLIHLLDLVGTILELLLVDRLGKKLKMS
jgi:hypothetical protein